MRTDLGQGFELVGPPLCDPRWFGHGEGSAVRKGSATPVAHLNRALQRILADGT